VLAMPKAGKYDYPTKSLDDCIKYVKKICKICGRQASRETVAMEALGMSPKGGATSFTIASLAKYGLIESKSGQIKVTDLGYQLAYAKEAGISEKEILRLKEEAIRNIPIFVDLWKYVQHKRDIMNEQLRAFLREIAHADLDDIPKIAPEIAKLYKENARYLTSKGLRPSVTKGKEQISPEKQQLEASHELLKIQYGDVFIQIPKGDKEAIKLAKAALEFMEKYEAA